VSTTREVDAKVDEVGKEYDDTDDDADDDDGKDRVGNECDEGKEKLEEGLDWASIFFSCLIFFPR
jgi:hypothetical protein